jgi:hypothetical protein
VTSRLPTTGMLFSAMQAVTHAVQPMQVVRSICMAHRRPSLLVAGTMVRGNSRPSSLCSSFFASVPSAGLP